MSESCHALDDPETLWSFCPSIALSYVFTALFGITTLVHFAQAIIHRKAYCWVITMGALWQTIAYIFRIISIQNPTSLGDYAAWFVLILVNTSVAPLWTNAFVYMVMGRLVWNFTADGRLYRLRASRVGLLFVVLDIITAAIQIYGAASASTGNLTSDQVLADLHIYMIGVGIQEGVILLFLSFAFQFHRTLLSNPRTNNHLKPQILLYTLYAVLILISVRIVFRLCEYSSGLTSTIPNHEVYQYCLDSLPMLIAFLLFNLVHPGRILPGKECDLPSRADRKKEKLSSVSDRAGFALSESGNEA